MKLAVPIAVLALAAPAVASSDEFRSHKVKTKWDSYKPSRDGKTLRIWWDTNSAYGLEGIRVREGRRRVVITVIEHAADGPTTDMAEYRNKRVRLKRPVWGRVVIDGATGKRRPAETPAFAR